jgi:hypothetical protein
LAKQTDGRRLAFRAILVVGPRCSVSLMTRTGLILEKSVYSPFNHLTQLLAPESFIQFSRSEILRFFFNSASFFLSPGKYSNRRMYILAN